MWNECVQICISLLNYVTVGVSHGRKIRGSNIGYFGTFSQALVGIVGQIPYIYGNRIEDNNLTKRTRKENLIKEISDYIVDNRLLQFTETNMQYITTHRGYTYLKERYKQQVSDVLWRKMTIICCNLSGKHLYRY